MFGFVFLIAVIFNLATVKTTDPEAVSKHAKDYFRVLPITTNDTWIPSVAQINPFFSHVEYWDNKLFLQSKTRFYVSWMGAVLTNGPYTKQPATIGRYVDDKDHGRAIRIGKAGFLPHF